MDIIMKRYSKEYKSIQTLSKNNLQANIWQIKMLKTVWQNWYWTYMYINYKNVIAQYNSILHICFKKLHMQGLIEIDNNKTITIIYQGPLSLKEIS